MTNAEIIEILETTAKYLEFKQEPPDLCRCFRHAVEIVSELDFPLEILTDSLKKNDPEITNEFRAIFGVLGRTFRHDLASLLFNGKFDLHDKLIKELPEGIQNVLRLNAPTPQQYHSLLEVLDVSDISKLEDACENHQVCLVPGFSIKEETEILEEIDRFYHSESKIYWANAEHVVNLLLEELGRRNRSMKVEQIRLPQSPQEAPVVSSVVVNQQGADQIEELQYAKKLMRGVNSFLRKITSPQNTRYLESIRAMEEKNRKREQNQSQRLPSDPRRETELPHHGRVNTSSHFSKTSFSSHHSNNTSFDDQEHSDRAARRMDRESQSPDYFRNEIPNPLFYRCLPGGEYRQLKDYLNEFIFLVETSFPDFLFDEIASIPFVRKVLKRQGNYLTVQLDGTQILLPFNSQKCPDLTVRFRAVPPTQMGAALLYESSSLAHWKTLKEFCEKKNYQLNEFGLYRGITCLTSESESRIYQYFDLPEIPPELRRNGMENVWLELGMPELIKKTDLHGDMHLHTTYTDGTGTIEQMTQKAIDLGYSYIVLTDHTKNVTVANGMDARETIRYWDAIDHFNERFLSTGRRFLVLKGLEVDILDDASLDLSDDVLSRADWIVASIHFGLDQSQKQIHRRYLGAFQNPYVKVIAHPTERILGQRSTMRVDIDFLCEEAKRYGKFLELNSQPRRLDLNDLNCRKAVEYGVPIVISSDSHAVEQMDYIQFGINQARRACLTKADVINTWSFNKMMDFVFQE